MHELQQFLGSDVTVCLDMGSFHLWIARHLYRFRPRQVLITNGQQILGVALPWGIAASILRPAEKILSISGERHAVLHVLRPQCVAAGVKRRGGNHGIVDRKAIPLGKTQSCFVDFHGERMNRQQAAQHGQNRMRQPTTSAFSGRATLANSLSTWTLMAPPVDGGFGKVGLGGIA